MFDRFKTTIMHASEAQLRNDPTLGESLVVEREGDFQISYAPFEHLEAGAKVVLVGITPGALQASNALISARSDALKGLADSLILANAKRFASFSGSMRGNLVAMLDAIGLAQWLGVETTACLWEGSARSVHFTSALRNPVFFRGANYTGSPAITAVPMLRRVVEESLALEVGAFSSAVWIPLGPTPQAALSILVRAGKLDGARVIGGLPHPSGANAERIAYFLGRKERALLSSKTNAVTIDAAKSAILAKVAAL